MHAQVIHPDPDDEFATDERCRILESWNDESDPAVSIARATVPRGTTTQLHCLKGIEERYLVVSGTGTVSVATLKKSVHPGDVVIIPANAPQSIRNDGDDDLVFYCICTPRFESASYRNLE